MRPVGGANVAPRYARESARWLLAVARCSCATVMRLCCHRRPTSYSAGCTKPSAAAAYPPCAVASSTSRVKFACCPATAAVAYRRTADPGLGSAGGAVFAGAANTTARTRAASAGGSTAVK